MLTTRAWDAAGSRTADCQWTDILGMVLIQQELLDWAYLQQWAPALGVADLLKEAMRPTWTDPGPGAQHSPPWPTAQPAPTLSNGRSSASAARGCEHSCSAHGPMHGRRVRSRRAGYCVR